MGLEFEAMSLRDEAGSTAYRISPGTFCLYHPKNSPAPAESWLTRGRLVV